MRQAVEVLAERTAGPRYVADQWQKADHPRYSARQTNLAHEWNARLRQGRTHRSCLHLALVALLALAGCAHVPPHAPAVPLPPGVDGYECYRREETASGFVYAKAFPDYHRGYASLTMGWETRNDGVHLPTIKLVWTRGPEAISPPGWITVYQTVQGGLPPLHSKMYLRLSSGEVLEREFADPKTWRQWKRIEQRSAGFAGLIHSEEPAEKEALGRAAWAEVEVVDPQGVTHAHTRLDLSHLQDDLAVMRRLGEEVEADAIHYDHRCAPFHIEVDTFGASAIG